MECRTAAQPRMTRGVFAGSARSPAGSLSQKKIDLVEKPGSGGFVLQKEVIPPGKRYETSMGNPSRHLTARIDRDHEIAAYMHDERWNLHLREQFAHIEIIHCFKVASRDFR